MSAQFVRITLKGDTENNTREVPLITTDGDTFATNRDICRIFEIIPESMSLLDHSSDVIHSDCELFPVTPDGEYSLFAELKDPIAEQTVQNDTKSLDSDPIEVFDLGGSDSDDNEALPTITKVSSKFSRTQSKTEDKDTGTSAQMKTDFPPGFLSTTKVPLDVDGDQKYATKFTGSVTKTGKGTPLLQLDFFNTNRCWSPAGNTTWKILTAHYGKDNVVARSQHCLGEAVCESTSCVWFRVHGKHLTKRLIKRNSAKAGEEYLGHKVIAFLFGDNISFSQTSHRELNVNKASHSFC